ncbi:unnamed protein product [Rotaria socialis]|uniref:Aspergillus nuclease S(1) n=4 Tax=Rotaria socialis TaxID=392032 RepID=A0A820HYC9_9BILA|nr:unnamed protein product [Rotaria socialis]CAF4303677.1 unnamed protein product [Rotaria socialis]
MFLTHWLLLALFCDTYPHVNGWGRVGHSITVRLAQSQLVDSAPDWIRSLTPWHWNGNLSAMSSWADSILSENNNPTGYANWQWSRILHYVNIPDLSCDYQPERDCINDQCILGAIKNYTRRLVTEHDHIQQEEALYFLIHFLGDIHQPLHTGFRGDRGGNSVVGTFMNETSRTNLHFLWDVGLIEVRLEKDFQQNTSLYYDYIYQLMINQTSQIDDNLEPLNEQNINLICSQIYFDENNVTMNASTNFTLGEIYYQRNIPIVEQRLVDGGRRLGALLNRLAKTRSQQPSDKKPKLCSGTIALIVILCLEGVLAIIGGVLIWLRFKNKLSTTYSISEFSKT